MGSTSVQLRDAPPATALKVCQQYDSSVLGTRYFCKTCGAKLFTEVSLPGMRTQWYLAGGAIDMDDVADDKDRLNVSVLAWIKDTKDGGLARRIFDTTRDDQEEQNLSWFPENWYGGPPASREDIQQIWQSNKSSTAQNEFPDKGYAKCHCGTIQLYITRPKTSKADLDKIQKRIRQNNTKYIGKLCACRSCRLATGVPLQPWTYVMPDCIFRLDDEPINFNFENGLNNLPGLKIYRSSQDVRRSFCGTCGATVFFERKDRPQIIDISFGLFVLESGALGEEWFEWVWNEASYSEECRDRKFLDMLVRRDN